MGFNSGFKGLISSVSFTSYILFEIMVDLVHQTIHTSFLKDNNQLEITCIKACFPFPILIQFILSTL